VVSSLSVERSTPATVRLANRMFASVSRSALGSYVVAFLLCLSAANTAGAQRGQAYTRQDPVAKHPGIGFPGFLDTEIAGAGSVVIQAPAFTMHVGLSEHLTFGTNLVFDAIVFSGNPAGLGWLRYRVRGTPRIQSTLDAIGGGLRIGSTIHHWFLAGISNTSIQLSERHRLTVNLLVGNVAIAVRDSTGTIDAAVTGIGTGLTYAFYVRSWFALSASLLPIPLMLGRTESSSARADVNFTGASRFLARTFYRAYALFQVGERWEFEVGGVGFGKTVLPWVSIGLKLGGKR